MLAPEPAIAQYLTRPQIPWRTITTRHFDVHFPAEMEEWTRGVAGRIEEFAQAVNAVVGNTPSSRVTVIVEDPSNVANGFALPFMEAPVVFLWPTPPSPSPTLGTHRGWGEILAVHEYGHIAHLTFPSRNPRERLLWRFAPTQISPVARKAPAWVIEGYATMIEGRLTGSGRPNSVGRAAVLRTWALEGKFPTYAQLNGSGAFLGGNMRYLVGSAFLEWLQDRRGDSSLVFLWRRMSARVNRSFDEAFAGVFGAGPADLYGAFSVDVMERALLVRGRLREAGLVEGELVQRLGGATGEPAVSPDGKRVAIVLRSLGGPSRLVVLDATPTPDSVVQRTRARMLALDSLDVAPFDSFPRPHRVLATLRPVNGRPHESPRWLPDGVSLLVTRDEPAANGVTRPDLFLWNTKTGDVRRVTRGAGIRQADPSPDGREAVGTRCAGGICSLVRIDLSSSSWTVLARGAPDTVWHRPRYSPQGTLVAAGVHVGDRWRLALVVIATGAVIPLMPDSVTRYAPAFSASGRELVAVSEAGGIANLEVMQLDSFRTRTITRLTSGAMAPDADRDGWVWYLTLRSGGYDLRRALLGGVALGVVAVQGGSSPAAPPTAVGPELPASRFPIPDSSHEYGLGPRRWRVLPGGGFGPEGGTGTMMVANIDPIARLSVVAQGGYGAPGTWRGGSIAVSLRRLSVTLDGAAWSVRHEPSRATGQLAPASADLRYTGGGVLARVASEESQVGYVVRAGGSIGTVTGDVLERAARVQALGDARVRVTLPLGVLSFGAAAGGSIAVGRTGGDAWQRAIGSGTFAISSPRGFLRADWLRGRVTAGTSPEREAEQFVVGGGAVPYFDPLFVSGRMALPAVAPGFVHGGTVQVLRATLGGFEWEPFAVWVGGGESVDRLQRLIGLERTFAVAALGFARLPAVRARAGAAYSIDEPFPHRVRMWASLSYAP